MLGHNWFKQKILEPHPSDSWKCWECFRCGKRRGLNEHALKAEGRLYEGGPKLEEIENTSIEEGEQ